MNRITDFFIEGESILLDVRPCIKRLYFNGKFSMLFGGISLLLLLANFIMGFSVLLTILAGGTFLVSLIEPYIINKTTKYVITTEQLIVESGLIGKDYNIIPKAKILDVLIDVDFLDTIWNTGRIKVCTASDSQSIVFDALKKPRNVYKKIHLLK